SRLTVDQERVLGAWTAMFAMVIERARERPLLSPIEQRRFLMEKKTAPEHWHVWLGLLASPHCSYAQACYGADQGVPITADLPRDSNAQETSIVAGRLLLWSFAFADMELEAKAIARLRVQAKSLGLCQIWPKRRILALSSPSTALTMQDIRAHRGRSHFLLTGTW